MFAKNRIYKFIFILLIFSSLLGSSTIFIFDFADEISHFQRAYDLSNLNFNLFLPDNTFNLGISFSDRTLTNQCVGNLECLRNPWKFEIAGLTLDEYFFKEYKDGLLGSMLMNAYSGFNYFIQSIGLFIVRIFSKNLLVNYFFGRLSFSLVWLFLSSFLLFNTLKKNISKEERLSISFLFLIYTFPTIIFNSTSFSGDAGIYAASVIASFSIIKLNNNNKKIINRIPFLKELILAISIGFSMLALISKTVYLPLVFSISIISYILIKNRFNKIIFSIFISLNFSFHLWWMEFSKSYIKEMYRIRRGELSGVNLQNYNEFLDFWKALFKTTIFRYEDLLRQIHGVFGNGPIAKLLRPHGYHEFFFLTLFIVLILLFFKRILSIKSLTFVNIKNVTMNKIIDRNFLISLLLLFSLLITYIGIYYAFYIYWERDLILVDIQGRYFLPIIFFLVPSIFFLSNVRSDEKNQYLDYEIYQPSTLINKMKKKIQIIFFNKIVIIFSASNILIYLENIIYYYFW